MDSMAALRAKIAAHEKWAALDRQARREATAAARKAAEDRWIKLAREKFGDRPQDELVEAAAQLRAAHFTRMALRSAQVRRARSSR